MTLLLGKDICTSSERSKTDLEIHKLMFFTIKVTWGFGVLGFWVGLGLG